MLFRIIQRNIVILLWQGAKRRAPPHLRPISFNFMHFLPENRMCAPPFATKQRPPIWKILDPPLSGNHTLLLPPFSPQNRTQRIQIRLKFLTTSTLDYIAIREV